ncbi:MAG TPA: argininosuccinate lyase [Candidatus Dormibacteraeota bacterium]|nr:argininosuccinate lyase [Candidatus Dormibacteraeota bacterium]
MAKSTDESGTTPQPKTPIAWEGRLPGPTEPRLQTFTTSLPQDLQMASQDVAGSLAHARALGRAGILDAKALQAIERGLLMAGRELSRGEFTILASDEDIHMAVERRLTELVGEPGQRLHTGRSRNDQVALDLRLWCRAATCDLVDGIAAVQRVLARRARQHQETLLPGYTHLQRAQPVQLAHHLLAYFEMLDRDQERLRDLDRRTDSSPLGAGALAGNTLGVDRRRPARELGFTRVSANSLDAVSDRDFVAELTFACALVAVHLSRLCEDLVIWNSREFSFITLPDRWATGSSLMPQKKNPDVLELVRGRTGRPVAGLMGVLTVLKGLPLSYDRDLQEDRHHLFSAVGSVQESLAVLAELLAAVRFNRPALARAAADPELLATDLAEWLVRQDVPFRLAHGMVARLVREAESRRLSLDQVVQGAWQRLGFSSESEAQQLFEPRRSLGQREQPGSPGPGRTRAALADAAVRIADHRAWARALRRRLPA